MQTPGTYQFLLGADDGAWVYIDNQLVVSEPGLHGTYETTGSKTLTAGMHSFRVDMFNWCCGYNLSFTTGFAASPAAPQVLAVSPANGLIQVPTNARITIQFNESPKQ